MILYLNLMNHPIPAIELAEGGSIMATQPMGGIMQYVVDRCISILNEIQQRRSLRDFSTIYIYAPLDPCSFAAIAFFIAALPIEPKIQIELNNSSTYIDLWTYRVMGQDWNEKSQLKEVKPE